MRSLAINRRTIAIVAAPALILLASVVEFLRFYDYSMWAPESLILLVGTTILGAILGGISRLRPETLAPLLTALLLTIFFMDRPALANFITHSQIVQFIGVQIGSFAALVTAWAFSFLALSIISYILRRHLSTIVCAVFVTVILATIILPAPTDGKAVRTGVLPAKLNDLPPVIHIILDEQIGLTGLPPTNHESQIVTEHILKTYRDFSLYTATYSRFAETIYSFTSLLNRASGPNLEELIEHKNVGARLRKNDWFQRLKLRGYAISVYQTQWFDLCNSDSSVDVCYTYPMFSVNPIQRAPLSTKARLRTLLRKILRFGLLPLYGQGLAQFAPLSSIEALEEFKSDIIKSPNGVAYIVHLLLPHFDYMYKSDCTLSDPAEWSTVGHTRRVQLSAGETSKAAAARKALYQLYLGQMICTNNLIDALFRKLKNLGVYKDATIVVHGDHGSRIGNRPFRYVHAGNLTKRDILDHYSTFFAIKAPSVESGINTRPAFIQDLFADRFLGGSEDIDDTFKGMVFVRESDTSAGRPNFAPVEAIETPTGGR